MFRMFFTVWTYRVREESIKLSCELHLPSFASAAPLKDVLRVLLYRIYFKNKPSVSCKNESEQVFNRFPSKIKC